MVITQIFYNLSDIQFFSYLHWRPMWYQNNSKDNLPGDYFKNNNQPTLVYTT
jgi:hypothetical protein